MSKVRGRYFHEKNIIITILFSMFLYILLALPVSATEPTDYAIALDTDEIILEKNLNGTADSFLGFSIRNTGSKPITPVIPDSRYLTFFSGTIQPGEKDWVYASLKTQLPIGEYQETILISDNSGKLNILVPVKIKVFGQGGFHTDKQELDFGISYEGRVLPPPQSFRILMDDNITEPFDPEKGSLSFENGNLGGNFVANYDKETMTVTVFPKSSIKPGVYNGTLSIRYLDYEIHGHQADVRIKMTILPSAPKIIKATVTQNQVDIYTGNTDNGFYDCYLSKSKNPADKTAIIKKSTYQKNSHVTFSGVPKGKYYILVRRVISDFGSSRYSSFASPKSVTVSVSTPERPTIMSTRVSGHSLTVSVSRSISTSGYGVSLSKYANASDSSDTAEKRPVFPVYTRKNLTSGTTTFKNLKPGTYYIGVQTYKKQNGQVVYSPWSKLKKITIK